jgi:2-oxoglutarate dehydrogenase E1 component
LDDAHLNAKKLTAMHNKEWLDSPWDGFFEQKNPMMTDSTGLPEETIKHIAEKFGEVPGDGFKLHSGSCFNVLLILPVFQVNILLTPR